MRFFPQAMEPPPFSQENGPVEVFGADRGVPILVVCDHASNNVPEDLNDLGLSTEALGRHIGWDIGAAVVARRLADRLGVTALLSRVSRLVIDCNRPLGHPTSIPRISDGTDIPGNATLTDREEKLRADAYFHPYHRAISHQLDRLDAQSAEATALVAIHSFTPAMNGSARPWHVGVLWNRDPRLAVPLIGALGAAGDLVVGDNQPYSGRDSNYTVDVHGEAFGRAHVSIEIRQDLIADDAGARQWGDRLAEILTPLLACPENKIRRIYKALPA
ncbi:N-formylglutamate amidohydrolase [Telmatospirillum sp.]|uniref:N-formylglutamate amidohydrolase n=1 Tax=Telmatospirillum sp. TaxID=2079197 RepID=UPI0028455EC5|nr:N-formylglutamate amidohydrolase [Telmatospirillum sp.]MDR3437494.1 N-formylglutamate amidohydrolase [Telmatospirillum sp.]